MKWMLTLAQSFCRRLGRRTAFLECLYIISETIVKPGVMTDASDSDELDGLYEYSSCRKHCMKRDWLTATHHARPDEGCRAQRWCQAPAP